MTSDLPKNTFTSAARLTHRRTLLLSIAKYVSAGLATEADLFAAAIEYAHAFDVAARSEARVRGHRRATDGDER